MLRKLAAVLAATAAVSAAAPSVAGAAGLPSGVSLPDAAVAHIGPIQNSGTLIIASE